MSARVQEAWDVLAGVPDPEVPAVSVVDLGIARAVEVSDDGERVTVTLTPTYSGCPATAVIERSVRDALARAFAQVEVRTELAPAWTTAGIGADARERLRAFGIAPPAPVDGHPALPVLDPGAPASCPHCGGTAVEPISEFGSTPCKALYRCTTCREPFDYFKRH